MSALLAMVLLLAAADPAAPAPDEGKLPASVEKLFEEKGKDGKPILGDTERAYLKKLPLHTRELIGKDVDAVTLGGAAHLKVLLSLELSSQAAAIVFSDNCILCHADPESQKKIHLFSADPKATGSNELLNLKNFVSDVHFRRGLSCAGCHGGSPDKDVMTPDIAARWPKADVRHQDRTWIPEFCARCHADPNFMRGFNPSLPTDQLAKYQQSVHYTALTKGNDLSAPTCNDCHGNHGAVPPGVGAIANVCGSCHAVFAEKFATSVHKQIFDKGCVECHSNHAVQKPSDAMLGVTGKGICQPCHTAEDKGDKGAAAAETMRTEFEQLKAAIDTSHALIARVKNAGIEVSDQELALREAATKLTLAHTEMHAFEPTLVAPIIADGTKIAAAVDVAGQKGVSELEFRRRGLAWSLAAIVLVVVGLALKVRQIDQRRQKSDV